MHEGQLEQKPGKGFSSRQSCNFGILVSQLCMFTLCITECSCMCRIQSPNKSIRQWRKSIQTEPAVPSLVNPIDAEDAMLARQTSGQLHAV